MFGASENVGSIEYDARIETKKLRADAADAERIVKKTGDDIGDHTERGTGRASEALHRFGKAVVVAMAAAGVAVVAFGVSSVKAFVESENAIAQTEAVLKSTNGVAGVTAKTITDLANSLQKQTRYSDETIRSAENMLLTFTNISDKTFPGATEAVLDMATAMGTDLKSTAIQVGKALQDPVLGATALQRVGVRLTESQKDLIKSLVDSGDAAGAQAVILKELQTEFGGSAKAAGETFAGKLDILKNQLGEVQESIGKVIIEALTPFANRLATFVQSDKFQAWVQILTAWLNENLPKAMHYVSDVLLPALVDIFKQLWPQIKTALHWFSELIQFASDHEWVVWALVGAFAALKLAMFLSGALAAFQGVMGGIGTAYTGMAALITSPITLPALGIAAVLVSIALMVNAFLDAKQTMDNTINSVRANIETAKKTLNELNNLLIYGTPAAAERAQTALLGLGATQTQINRQLGISKFASGTNFAPGGIALVGEQGPEIVNLPRGSQVIPNHEIDNVVGGVSNVSVSVSLSGIMTRSKQDEREIARSLVQTLNDELSAKGMQLIGGGAL